MQDDEGTAKGEVYDGTTVDMMAVGGPDDRTDSGAADEMLGFLMSIEVATEVRQTQMRALEENNGDMNGADKGRTEAAEDGSVETAASGQRRMWFGDFEMVARRQRYVRNVMGSGVGTVR